MSDALSMNRWFTRVSTVTMALTLLGLIVLFWMTFIQRISPVESQRIISMEATKIAGHTAFIITHEFCLSRTTEGDAVRIFRRVPASPESLEEVYEVGPSPIMLLAGCHKRPRTVDVPDITEAGSYIYQLGLRFCNEVRCKTEWMEPVTFLFDGAPGRHALLFQDAPSGAPRAK